MNVEFDDKSYHAEFDKILSTYVAEANIRVLFARNCV